MNCDFCRKIYKDNESCMLLTHVEAGVLIKCRESDRCCNKTVRDILDSRRVEPKGVIGYNLTSRKEGK